MSECAISVKIHSKILLFNILKFSVLSTPIKNKTPDEPQQLLEIKDDDKVITAYLASRSIKIQRGFTKRQTLEEYAKLNSKRVVYIQ